MDEGRDPTADGVSRLRGMAHHGNTPAAWAAVVVGLLGFTVGGVGLMFDPVKMPIFWVGVAITVGGRRGLRGHGPSRHGRPRVARRRDRARRAPEPPATRGRRMLAPGADHRRPRAGDPGAAPPRPAPARQLGALPQRGDGLLLPRLRRPARGQRPDQRRRRSGAVEQHLVTLMIPVAMLLLALWALDRWHGRAGTCRGTGCGRR